MLWDEAEGGLRIEVAIGIEKELISKIRIRPSEGIAGIAFAERRPILLSGKADQKLYEITRERSDVESAISVPLIHGDLALGVLNLSHSLRRGAFSRGGPRVRRAPRARSTPRSSRAPRSTTGCCATPRACARRAWCARCWPSRARCTSTCRRSAATWPRSSRGGIAHVFLVDRRAGRARAARLLDADRPARGAVPDPAQRRHPRLGRARAQADRALEHDRRGLRLLRGAAAARARRPDRAPVLRGHARSRARPSCCARRSARWPTRSRWRSPTRCARCSWSARRPRPARSPSSRRGSARRRTPRSYTAR